MWLALPGVVGWAASALLVWFYFSAQHLETLDTLIPLSVVYVVVVVPVAAVCGVFFTRLAVRRSDGSPAQVVAAILVTLINLSFTAVAVFIAWSLF